MVELLHINAPKLRDSTVCNTTAVVLYYAPSRGPMTENVYRWEVNDNKGTDSMYRHDKTWI